MLHNEIVEMNDKIDRLLAIFPKLPEWYPLTIEFANECGYSTTDGLRKWCVRNLPPSDMKKIGSRWQVRRSALHLLKIR